MESILSNPEFYPTPKEIIKKMVEPYAGPQFRNLQILEPSAGTGGILDYITGEDDVRWSRYYADKKNVYAIEPNDECVMILQNKGYRLIGNDFLSYKPVHDFNLIVMNPPFSNGDEHLLHAWEIMSNGDIVCLLNANTITNPCTRRRQILGNIIKECGSVEMLGQCFKTAERKTDVDIALVRLHKDTIDDRWHIDFGDAAKTSAPDFSEDIVGGNAVALNDKIGSYLHGWEKAQEAAVEYIKARRKLEFYGADFLPMDDIVKVIEDSASHNITPEKSMDMPAAFNSFIDAAKSHAWRAIIYNMGMDKYMTANLRKTFDKFVEQQGAYELNRENIYKLVSFVALNSQNIMRKAVVDLFDTFTKFFKDNTEITEGWKSNSRFKVNRKIVLPYFVECGSDGFYDPNYYKFDTYRDIDKVMCYLSGVPYECMDTLTPAAEDRKRREYGFRAKAEDYAHISLKTAVSFVRVGDNRQYESEFFYFRCYKKGTLHIIFKDSDLLDRLNITVNEGKKELGYAE